MTLQLGSAELFKDTSATDEVSLPYIDDISPHELKAAEVMVKEEVRHFFSTRACSHSIDRSRFATKALLSRAILRDSKNERDVDDRWTLPLP